MPLWKKSTLSAYDRIKQRGEEGDERYLEMHETQQLDRERIKPTQSTFFWNIATAVVGLITFSIVWVIGSAITWGTSQFQSATLDKPSYYQEPGLLDNCYYPLDADGIADSTVCYSSADQVPVPDWFATATEEYNRQSNLIATNFSDHLIPGIPSGDATLIKFAAASIICAVITLIFYILSRKWHKIINADRDTTSLNQHQNEGRLKMPMEIIERSGYKVVPNAGAHHETNNVGTVIAHFMLKDKGIKKVEVAKRHQETITNEFGDVIAYEGDVVIDEDDEIVTEVKPLIDVETGTEMYEASKVPVRYHKFYDATEIVLPKSAPDGSDETLAEHINRTWTLPLYEWNRPSGCYAVDVNAVNTMLIAITRGGKGQGVIEPSIDIWSREEHKWNGLANDPKAELFLKFYIKLSMRGYQVLSINLLNYLKTDIFNVLEPAITAAREGDYTRYGTAVDKIGEVFFPTDGGDDPMWATAASNAFKRSVFVMIAYYDDMERRMRIQALKDKTDERYLEAQIDRMWGKVTLYNVYQFFVRTISKKRKDPLAAHTDMLQRRGTPEDWAKGHTPTGDYAELSEEEIEIKEKEANAQSFLWDGAAEADNLTLMVNAMEALPRNKLREMAANANNSLKSMAGADRMISSVFGITVTNLAFFTEPTIARLTSGTPSQSINLRSFPFPRGMGVRFDTTFLKKVRWIDTPIRWSSYRDANFSEPYVDPKAKDAFVHDDAISGEGWARAYFAGIFDQATSYLKLEILDSDLSRLDTYYFKFIKGYKTNQAGDNYVMDPILGEKIIENGELIQMIQERDENGQLTGRYVEGMRTFKQKKVKAPDTQGVDLATAHKIRKDAIQVIEDDVPTIMRPWVSYSERPKFLFMMNPPHMLNYAKVSLLVLSNLLNINFDMSYMTKSSQKPQVGTRYVLDEIGNLQNAGSGIDGLETYLSIGLGQDQQFSATCCRVKS